MYDLDSLHLCTSIVEHRFVAKWSKPMRIELMDLKLIT